MGGVSNAYALIVVCNGFRDALLGKARSFQPRALEEDCCLQQGQKAQHCRFLMQCQQDEGRLLQDKRLGTMAGTALNHARNCSLQHGPTLHKSAVHLVACSLNRTSLSNKS